MAEAQNISLHTQKQLEDFLREHSASMAATNIGQRAPDAVVPLTFAQQQVWLHAQLAPDTSAYNEPFTVYRLGGLDVGALERSFTEIVRRHEAWRTSFPIVDGQPVQRVHPPFDIKLPVIDLRNLPETERVPAALRLASEDARRPFDLAKAPPIRAQLVRLAENEYRLFINCHHLIFDGITAYRVFLPELIAMYKAFSTGKPSSLPELPFQYGDYALWQRQSRNGDVHQRNLAYWKRQLAGPLPVLRLPTDRARASVESFGGAMQAFSLSLELTTQLRSLSNQYGATLFMTLLAAWAALLSRFSGQEDILVGSVTAGRKHPGTEKLLGFFLNTIVLRTNLGGDPTFPELLQRVRGTTIDALTHDDVPLDQIVRELHPDREVGRNPLFRVLLSLEPTLPASDPGWDLTPIDVDTGASKFDLCLVLDDRSQGLSGRMIYSTDLFDASTISRTVECWKTLLQSVVADPEQRLSQISIVPETERQRLVQDWSGTEKSFPFVPVHKRFESIAARSPQAIAVKCGKATLSFGELDQRANKLADYLRHLGVGPEVPVALCVERSLEMIIGIVGILKAGGAYVPLDPTYPRERLSFMLGDCQAPVLLTQQHLPRISAEPEVQTVQLDSDWGVIAKAPERPGDNLSPEHLAYVIYTSGSTGEPKGVEITQGSLSYSTGARLDYYQDAGKVFLLLSSFAFDSSVATIFHALCSGGTLVLPPADFDWEARRISELIRRHEVESMLSVPSLYSELLGTAAPDALRSLQRVILAGEACARQLVTLHFQTLPQTELFNEYGPTEATVWSTVYKCDRQPREGAVPIGRPIANAKVYVLDRNLQLLPIGVPGELYISGQGVARGYRNRPELTREQFLANPYGGNSKATMYRTGDVACWREDGSLQFLGRADEQVKFRGLRIELGEVEAVLTEHPDVQEAVVTVQEDARKPRLIAHVIVREQYATSAAELRGFLKARLPEYMVPSTFSFVHALPRTPNGKVDRQALLSQQKSTTELSSFQTVARDSTEARLLEIWKEVLEIDRIDVTKDFFELGGHSLLAAKLLYRIEQEFNQSLSLAFVFQAPTVEMMADWLRSPDHSLRARAIIEIQPNGSRPPLFCVRAGPRFRLLAQKLGPDQPFLGLDIPYSDAIRLPTPYRVEDIASFLIKAMREVQPRGPYYLAGLCVNAVIAYEVARQLWREGDQVALLAMFDGHNGAYYKNPFRDGRYTGRIKYHLANLLQLDFKKGSAYIFARFEEARRKLERTMWRLSSEQGSGRGGKLHNTDSVVHPAFYRYEPGAYPGSIVLFQSSDWPAGEYFNFELGWKDLVQGGVVFHRIPGNHPSMFREPNVNLLAARLKDQLRDAATGIAVEDHTAKFLRLA